MARFMVFVKATPESEAGAMPTEEILDAMGKYNEELVKAGIMLDGGGLRPSSQGVRIRFDGKSKTVTDGPFAETKELVAGYWLLQASSRDEVVEWLKRSPFQEGEIEIRQLFELEDFDQSPAVDRHRALQQQLGSK